MIKHLYSTLILFFAISFASQAQQITGITSTQASQVLKTDKKVVVLDVRTANEFNEGHIQGAVNIDISQPDALSKINKLDRNAKYIVHCRTNRRSKTAVDQMAQHGFKTIYQMTDGFMGWSQNGLPIVK